MKQQSVIVLLILGVIHTVSAVTPLPSSITRGMTFFPFSEDVISSQDTINDLSLMKSIGVQLISITPLWTAPSLNSSYIYATEETASLESLQTFVQACREQNLEVMIKPIITIKHNASIWLEPEDPQYWFQNYTNMLLMYTQLNPDYICLGVELIQLTTDPKYNQLWQNMITTIRSNFTGQLTYAALYIVEYPLVSFWNELDWIGIDAYFPLATPEDPYLPVGELTANMDAAIDEVRDWRNSSGLNYLPVMFTEVGYPTYNYGSVTPALPVDECTNEVSDFTVQENCYEALFDSVSKNADMVTSVVMFWLDNDSTSDHPGAEDWPCLWTPRNKPAFKTMQIAFSHKSE